VPRTYSSHGYRPSYRPYYRPYYSRPYYYSRYSYPYGYSRYYSPSYYNPYYAGFGFGIGFGFGWSGSYGYPYGYPSYGYPSYGYPSYGYPYGSPSAAYPYSSAAPDDYGYGGSVQMQRPAPAPSPAYTTQRSAPQPATGEQGAFGTLSLQVNPAEAVILIDGEAWERPQGQNRFSIDLLEGPHRVEVREQGYGPYARTVDVRGGAAITLNVSLSPGSGQAQLNVRRTVPLR
jgi:hypothetical protein